MLLGGLQAVADTPLPFGVRVQDVESLESHHSNVVFDTDSHAAADAAVQALVETEQRLGPYDPQLAPMFVEAATLALATGDIDGGRAVPGYAAT